MENIEPRSWDVGRIVRAGFLRGLAQVRCAMITAIHRPYRKKTNDVAEILMKTYEEL